MPKQKPTEKNAEEAGAVTITSPSSKVAPAKPQQRSTRQHPKSKPTAKQIRYKKANPNATHTFNHRAQFTKFKRRIHAQRQWALEALQEGNATVPQAQNSETGSCHSSRTSSSYIDEAEAQGAEHENVSDQSRPTPFVAAAQTVSHMHALYAQLDAAMQQRRYGRAAFLQRCLRARRHQLRRALLQSRQRTFFTTEDSLTDDTKQENVHDAAVPPSPQPYRSFHPSSTLLGLGRHPHSAWVDQRSGRYPALCTPEQIKFVVQHFSEDSEGVGMTLPEAQQQLMPQLPSPTTETRSPPVATAQTRLQKKQRASLFVADYCVNIVTDALDDMCFTVLQSLYQEQRELKQKQPLQFKARQRYVVGFQEVLKCLKAGRVKLVLLATDIEALNVNSAELESNRNSASADAQAAAAPHKPTRQTRKKAFQSLHEAVHQVQQLCGGEGASGDASTSRGSRPLCLTCMSRHRLSYALHAKGSHVGCVAIMQAEKSREPFKAVVSYGRFLTHLYAEAMARVTPKS